MAELVDAPDSKSGAFGRSGSTPDIPTIDMMKQDYSKKIKIKNLNYIDPLEVLKRFQDYSEIVFLDSAGKYKKNNRFSYIAIDPVHSYKIKNTNCNNIFNKKDEKDIKQLLRKNIFKKKKSLPEFQCGLAGYISYDHCLGIENVKKINKKKPLLHNLYLGVFDIVIAFDLKLKRSYLYSYNLDDIYFKNVKLDHRSRRQKIINLYSVPRISNQNIDNIGFKWKSELTKQNYLKKIKKILNYIRSGDIFQVNFTQRFTSSIPKDFSSIFYYLTYREKTSTPFSAFIKHDKTSILSYSPERFLKVNQNRILTSPIKGTIRRGGNIDSDKKLKNELLNSSKDHAENLMIVDVLRNDMSKVSSQGSVKVKKLAELETYRNVHHLVSSIESKLSNGKDVIDLLNASLPGGSITGAPKIRAMEIISELEKNNRGVYCGTIGYISFSGQSDFNIPIRTITVTENLAYLNSGGGIVYDSNPEKEYKELISKVSNLFIKKNQKSKIANKRDAKK